MPESDANSTIRGIPDWAQDIDRIRGSVIRMHEMREAWLTGAPPDEGFTIPLEEARFLLDEIEGRDNKIYVLQKQLIDLGHACSFLFGSLDAALGGDSEARDRIILRLAEHDIDAFSAIQDVQ